MHTLLTNVTPETTTFLQAFGVDMNLLHAVQVNLVGPADAPKIVVIHENLLSSNIQYGSKDTTLTFDATPQAVEALIAHLGFAGRGITGLSAFLESSAGIMQVTYYAEAMVPNAGADDRIAAITSGITKVEN